MARVLVSREEAKKYQGGYGKDTQGWANYETILALYEQNAALLAALQRMAVRHFDTCYSELSPGGQCSCGADEARAAIAQAERQGEAQEE